MCGHVGIAGKLEARDEHTMKRLLIFDYFRGPDSTGFAALRNDKTHRLVKIANSPIDLFDTKKFVEALSGYNSTVFLGHNRFATKGAVNNVNAHPYEYGDVVGAHNGTLDVASWKALERAIGEEFAVDSMAIIAGIAKLGIEAVTPLLSGAWALVWIDKADNTLNFLRNKERPFWYAFSEKCDKIFWGSEWAIIQASLKLSTTTYEVFTNEKNEGFFQTKENMWYRYDIDELKTGGTVPMDGSVKELLGKEPTPVYTHTAQYQSPFPARGNSTPSTTTRGTTAGTGNGNVTTIHSHVQHLKGTKTQPFGGFVTKSQFDDLARWGCSWCQADVEFDEPGVEIYVSDQSVLCKDCSKGDDDHNRVYVDQLN